MDRSDNVHSVICMVSVIRVNKRRLYYENENNNGNFSIYSYHNDNNKSVVSRIQKCAGDKILNPANSEQIETKRHAEGNYAGGNRVLHHMG